VFVSRRSRRRVHCTRTLAAALWRLGIHAGHDLGESADAGALSLQDPAESERLPREELRRAGAESAGAVLLPDGLRQRAWMRWAALDRRDGPARMLRRSRPVLFAKRVHGFIVVALLVRMGVHVLQH